MLFGNWIVALEQHDVGLKSLFNHIQLDEFVAAANKTTESPELL